MAAATGLEHLVHGVLNGNHRFGRAGSEAASDPGLLLDLVRGRGEEVADCKEKVRGGEKGWPLGRAWMVTAAAARSPVAAVDEGKVRGRGIGGWGLAEWELGRWPIPFSVIFFLLDEANVLSPTKSDVDHARDHP